jgi:hypothetical protein
MFSVLGKVIMQVDGHNMCLFLHVLIASGACFDTSKTEAIYFYFAERLAGERDV